MALCAYPHSRTLANMQFPHTEPGGVLSKPHPHWRAAHAPAAALAPTCSQPPPSRRPMLVYTGICTRCSSIRATPLAQRPHRHVPALDALPHRQRRSACRRTTPRTCTTPAAIPRLFRSPLSRTSDDGTGALAMPKGPAAAAVRSNRSQRFSRTQSLAFDLRGALPNVKRAR
ncbi:hypothetical protein C8R46DRAFT_1213496 [Mycena filopes]|nr:hypothetical protein C8R46DRAFT_1213496 [Mycena filopes]